MGPIQFTANNCWLRRRGAAMQILILLVSVDCSMLVAVDLVSLSKPTLHSRPLKQHSALSRLCDAGLKQGVSDINPRQQSPNQVSPLSGLRHFVHGIHLGPSNFQRKIGQNTNQNTT